jgi:hypothetical protein
VFNPNYIPTVDQGMLREILAACPDRDDPRMIARFAIGVTSPRLTASKLTSHPLFGKMVGTNYDLLLEAIDVECAAAGYAVAPPGASNFSPPKRTASTSTASRHPRRPGVARHLAAAFKRVLIRLMGVPRGDGDVEGTEVDVGIEERSLPYMCIYVVTAVK